MNSAMFRSIITKLLLSITLPLTAFPASALNVLLTNDDGLTSNIRALYSALKLDGHDVIVSVPCQGQSGMGGAILFQKPLTALESACLHGAASAGDPGAGPYSKKPDAIDYGDFYYVNGTPIMATSYGLDVLAKRRWNASPDLVISGPNEGRNAGPIIKSSGTVNNALFAASRGIPSMAVSAGLPTHTKLDASGHFVDNPGTSVVARLTANFLKSMLSSRKGTLPLNSHSPLNINFPDTIELATEWEVTEVGNYTEYDLVFREDLSGDSTTAGSHGQAPSLPGLSVRPNTSAPSKEQLDDEAFVSLTRISVSIMQPSFGPANGDMKWLKSLVKQMNRAAR